MVSELELIQAAQVGCRKAAGKLIRMHSSFMFTIARRYGIPGYDINDLLQLARIGFLEGIMKYDPGKGVKLITFAVHYIRKQFFYVVNLHRAKKRSWVTISFDSPVQDTEFILSDVLATPEQESTEQYLPLLQECISSMKHKKRRAVMKIVVEQLAIGEIATLQEIGDRLNVGREMVRQLKEKAIAGPKFQRLKEDLRTA